MQIEKFIDSQYGWAKTTKQTAEKHLESWKAMLNGQGIEGVTVRQFEEWRKDVSASMRYNSLWAFKSYLAWAKIESPLREHTVKRELPPPQPYTKPEEAQALISACDLYTYKGLQDACIVAFLWETWTRADGLVTMTLDRLDLDNQEVILIGKGREFYTAGFGPDLKDLLERWLPVHAERAKCNSLFINIRTGNALTYGGLRSILENLGDKTGIYRTPHDFRRGAATNFANNGGNDRRGMAQGNWKSHKMYQRYTRSVSLEGFKTKRWMNKDKDE